MTYQVSFPEPIRDRLAKISEKVMAIGMGKELARVLSDLMLDLTDRPMEAGETIYHLRHIPMPVKVLAKEYLSVVFVVHDADQLVMVTKLKMLAGHPFPRGYEEYLNE
jgi:hypothetical protein